MKYYVIKNGAKMEVAIKETKLAKGCSTVELAKMNPTKQIITVELPQNNGLIRVISKGKEYPDYKVALAVAAGQIKVENLKGVK